MNKNEACGFFRKLFRMKIECMSLLFFAFRIEYRQKGAEMMKIKRFLLVVALVCLCACGAQHQAFNLEKEGLLYNYSDNVMFYYPRDWRLEKDDLKLSVDIESQDSKEAIFLDVYAIEARNATSELVQIYCTKLENLGVSVTSSSEIHLTSGQSAYRIDGENSRDGTFFSEIVLFVGNQQYVFSYVAEKEVYEQNISEMWEYLMSLTVSEAQNVIS